jgi:hypothetical protein
MMLLSMDTISIPIALYCRASTSRMLHTAGDTRPSAMTSVVALKATQRQENPKISFRDIFLGLFDFRLLQQYRPTADIVRHFR